MRNEPKPVRKPLPEVVTVEPVRFGIDGAVQTRLNRLDPNS